MSKRPWRKYWARFLFSPFHYFGCNGKASQINLCWKTHICAPIPFGGKKIECRKSCPWITIKQFALFRLFVNCFRQRKNCTKNVVSMQGDGFEWEALNVESSEIMPTSGRNFAENSIVYVFNICHRRYDFPVEFSIKCNDFSILENESTHFGSINITFQVHWLK